jgi:hypothetical protein
VNRPETNRFRRRPSNPLSTKPDRGFALALTVAVGIILGIGALAMVIRASSALMGSIRSQQSKEALAVAEAGVESVIGKLNTHYPYLLVNNHPNWGSPSFIPTHVCRNMQGISYASMPTAGEVKGSNNKTLGNWQVVSYGFRGNFYFGGTGILRVEGTRVAENSNKILAKAQVEQEVSVKYKDCTPRTHNTIALLGETVNVGSTQVREEGTNEPGNVLCTSCGSTADMNINASAIGDFMVGPFPVPGVPEMPAGLEPWDISLNPAEISRDPKSAQIVSGQPRTVSGKQVCLVDSSGITHCRINSVRLVGSESATLKIIYPNSSSATREVRLYTEGNIGLGGNAAVCQAIADGTTDPPCLTNPSSHGLTMMSLQWLGSSSCTNQDIKLNGGGNALNMFVYFPCGSVQINGGSNSPDIRGAVWTKAYSSSGGNVDIEVPPDLIAQLQQRFGSQFSLSLKRPVAIGINRWLSFEQIK